MPSYRVSFINDIPSRRQAFSLLQRSMSLAPRTARKERAGSSETTLREARGICHWSIQANRIELEVINLPAKPERARSQLTGDRERA
jgi:hypothetical protein